MRRLQLFAVLSAVCSFPFTASAADPNDKPEFAAPAVSSAPTPSVVVLDVTHVFKNHLRFKQRMDRIRQEIDDFNKDTSTERQAIFAEALRQKDFKTGSAEYKNIGDTARRKLAELQLQAVSRQNEILNREGRIYYETYQEIVAAVTVLAQRYNFSLVIRYDSEEADNDDRGSVLKTISRDVVYQQGLDITKLVLEYVNSASLAKSSGGQGSGRRQ